jgi:UDP-N-acetylmuramoyl-tripeptide--D-alanyl-D-alanine ligase
MVREALGVTVAHAPSVYTAISTDTRTLGDGALFVALRGERFDGHDHLVAARDAGAVGAVVVDGTPDVPGLALYRVDDTRAALGRLAAFRRRVVAGPVVAITGTNGKTVTKELAALALATRWRVHATPGNLNNEIGVPLTLLNAPGDTQALVVEAGASVPGEISRLRRIITPSVAMVTNVSAGHLEGFGTLDDVLIEKASLLEGAPLAIVGTDPPGLATRARELAERVVVAGLAPAADVRPDSWKLDDLGRIELVYRGVPVRLPLAGRHQGANAMLVLALADVFRLDLLAVAKALTGVTLPGGRWEVHEFDDRLVINDAYNANPASLDAALATVQAIRRDRPLVVIVGTMLELGAEADRAHRAAAEAVLAVDPTLIGAVGAFVPAFKVTSAGLGDRLVTADTPDALGRALGPRIPAGAIVLLKGSRGVRLEQALPHLLPTREEPCSTTS